MIYDYGFADKIPDNGNIGVLVSGGTDSAIALYLLCEYITKNKLTDKTTIYPLHGVDRKRRPTSVWDAYEIINFCKNAFPNVDFFETLVWDNMQIRGVFDSDFEPFDVWNETEKDQPNHHRGWIKTISKRQIDGRKTTQLLKWTSVKLLISGLTRNPPNEVIEKFYMPSQKFQADRSNFDVKEICSKQQSDDWTFYKYQPFINEDKRYVANLYKQYNLLETLFPLTASCIAQKGEVLSSGKVHDFSEPCRECFWCNEKHWAFGMYDGGVK